MRDELNLIFWSVSHLYIVYLSIQSEGKFG